MYIVLFYDRLIFFHSYIIRHMLSGIIEKLTKIESLCRDSVPLEVKKGTNGELQDFNVDGELNDFKLDFKKEIDIVNICVQNDSKIYSCNFFDGMKERGQFVDLEDFQHKFEPNGVYETNQKDVLINIVEATGYSKVAFTLWSFASKARRIHKNNYKSGGKIKIELREGKKMVEVYVDGVSVLKELQIDNIKSSLNYLLIYDSAKEKVTAQDFEGLKRENVVSEDGDIFCVEQKTRFFYRPNTFIKGEFWIPTIVLNENQGFVYENRRVWVVDGSPIPNNQKGFCLINWKKSIARIGRKDGSQDEGGARLPKRRVSSPSEP